MTSLHAGARTPLSPRFVHRLRSFAIAFLFLLFTGSCGDRGSFVETPATDIQFRQLEMGPLQIDLFVGETTDVAVRLIAESGTTMDPNQVGAAMAWTSRDTTVARVDRLGRVSAVAPGTASIVARYRDLSAELLVKVGQRPDRISLTSTSVQGQAGGAVSGGVVVQVLDASGVAIPGVPVRFTVLTGAGSAEPAQTSTNVEGRAFTSWTLGGTVGRQSLQVAVLRGGAGAASSAGNAAPSADGGPAAAPGNADEVLTSAIIFANAEASVPGSVVISPSATSLSAGEARVFSARVVDEFANDVGDQTVSFASSNPEVLTVSDGGTVVGRRAGTAKVIVASRYLGVEATATVTVVAGSAKSLVKVSGDAQTGTSGNAASQPLVVEVIDVAGNPVSGAVVNWTTTAGAVTPGKTPTNSTGRAQVMLVLGQAGSHTISAAVTSLDTMTFTATASVRTQPPPPPPPSGALAIATTSLPGGTSGAVYDQPIAVNGGSGAYAWSLATGSLPPGLSMSTTTGAITGTPVETGTWAFTAHVASGSSADTQPLAIAVFAPGTHGLEITTPSLSRGSVAHDYRAVLTATGGSGAYTWSVRGELPPGLSLNASTGAITGTPATAGTWSFTVDATSGALTNTKAFSITIGAPASGAGLDITTASLPEAIHGVWYATALGATGGSATYSWSLAAGALPAGMALDRATGTISGTATVSGSFSFTVQVTSGGSSATRPLSLSVSSYGVGGGGGGGGGGGTGQQGGGGGGLIRDIDFESYSSTAALMSDCVTFSCVYDEQGAAAGGTGVVELDATVAPPIAGLTKSMRYSYMHPGDGCNSITVERAVSFPAAQEAWGEFYVRWSSNFRTSNNDCAPNDHKLIFGDTEDELSGRWAFYVGADSPPNHSLMVEQPMRTDGVATGAYYLNRNFSPLIQPYPYMWDGNWHVIRLHFRHSTTTTSNDGAIQVWIDGRLLHDETGFSTKKPNGAPERINGFSFSHNKDDGPAGVLMHLWWGRIRVWTSNPGW